MRRQADGFPAYISRHPDGYLFRCEVRGFERQGFFRRLADAECARSAFLRSHGAALRRARRVSRYRYIAVKPSVRLKRRDRWVHSRYHRPRRVDHMIVTVTFRGLHFETAWSIPKWGVREARRRCLAYAKGVTARIRARDA